MKTINKYDWMIQELEALKGKNLYRKLRVLEELKGTKAKIRGRVRQKAQRDSSGRIPPVLWRKITLFCGNDYLGLSQHPKLIEAFQKVSQEWGVGSGSARLISGTSHWHETLEKRIASFLGKGKALLFSSGYLANLGVLSGLTNSDDLIVIDKLSHASLIDAARLSKATVRVYPHKNLDYLEKILKQHKVRHPEPFARCHSERSEESGGLEGKLRKGSQRFFGRGPQNDISRIWVVTDSIFSMDGDLAPLPELVELKNRYGAYLMIDEAHATGVFGPNGKGVSEHFGVSDSIDVHIGTLSKAIGVFGGFVAGSHELIEYLINRARTFIFETALPASVCAAALQAFDLIERENVLRSQLWGRVEQLRKGLKGISAPILESASPIIPVVFGDEKKTLEAAEFLLKEGFLVPAVRYPAVPKGKARLRITVSSAHSEGEVDRLIFAFKRLLFEADKNR